MLTFTIATYILANELDDIILVDFLCVQNMLQLTFNHICVIIRLTMRFK